MNSSLKELINRKPKVDSLKMLQMVWNKEPFCTVGGNVIDTATVDNIIEVPQKAKNRTSV